MTPSTPPAGVAGDHEDVRAQLRGLAGRGVRWPVGRWPDRGPLRPAAVLVLFGVLDRLPASHATRAVLGVQSSAGYEEGRPLPTSW